MRPQQFPQELQQEMAEAARVRTQVQQQQFRPRWAYCETATTRITAECENLCGLCELPWEHAAYSYRAKPQRGL